jgi:hypothetical protein
MNVRQILSGVVGLVMIAPFVVATAASADPYGTPDDVAAYQAYTGQAQYGQPMLLPSQYPSLSYAQRNQLEGQLNYAEVQYRRAQQVGDWNAAKHWKRQIKHIRRELSGGVHHKDFGSGYGQPGYATQQGPPYAPPGSAYAPSMQGYPPLEEGQAYGQPYPPNACPPTGPNAGYGAPGFPGQTGVLGQTGSTGGLSSLLGPLLGGGGAPSAPLGGYPQPGYPNTAAGSPYGAPGSSAQTGSMGALGSLLGPLLGGRTTP